MSIELEGRLNAKHRLFSIVKKVTKVSSLWDICSNSQPCTNGITIYTSHKKRTKGVTYQKIYAQYIKPKEKYSLDSMLRKVASLIYEQEKKKKKANNSQYFFKGIKQCHRKKNFCCYHFYTKQYGKKPQIEMFYNLYLNKRNSSSYLGLYITKSQLVFFLFLIEQQDITSEILVRYISLFKRRKNKLKSS